MDTSAVIDALAATSLGDDEFAAAAEQVRVMAARIGLADEMARQVIAAGHYLPAGCVGAAVEYVALYASYAVQTAA